MGLFSFLFGKKKKNAEYVIEKEDGQEQFLKSDEEMNAPAPKKKTVTAKKPKAEASTSPGKTSKMPSSKSKTNEKTNKPSLSEDEDIDYDKTIAVKEGKETRNGIFDVRRGKDGRFFFSLYASNHAPIAFSQMYSTSSAAMNGISSVIDNSPKAPTEDTTLKNPTALPFPKWEIYIDRAGEYRFRLYATNGQCICHSYHGYSTKSGCKGGIESIKRFSAEAKVDKSYLN